MFKEKTAVIPVTKDSTGFLSGDFVEVKIKLQKNQVLLYYKVKEEGFKRFLEWVEKQYKKKKGGTDTTKISFYQSHSSVKSSSNHITNNNMLPGIENKKTIVSLGQPATRDGTSLLVISAPTTYTITATEFLSLKNAEDAGITQAKDLSENALVWEHVKDFYAYPQNEGVELHVLLVSDATTFTKLFTTTESAYQVLQDYLVAQAGGIRLIAVALNPVFAEDHTTAISLDLQTAIPLAHSFVDVEFGKGRPCMVMLEGRKFAGTAAAALDLRDLASGNVMVGVSRDATRQAQLVTDGHTGNRVANYAAIGLLLGKTASLPVGENVGRLAIPPSFTENDALPGVVSTEFSGGQALGSFTEADLGALHEKAYCFIYNNMGYPGYYFVNDHTCEVATKSNSRLSYNRVVNKMAVIARATLLPRVKSSLRVTAEGKLFPSTIEQYKNLCNRAISQEMINNPDPLRLQELSSVDTQIDANQNILATNTLFVKVSGIPIGSTDVISVEFSLSNPANA